MSAVWSPYQEAIFDFVENCEGNAIIKAVAGSGKSTTIIEATKRLPKTKGSSNLSGYSQASCILLAFNKSIAEELKSRGVNAKTFHSLTYSAVTKSRQVNNVETNKMRVVIAQCFDSNDAFIYGNFCIRLVGLAKQSGFGCLINDTEADWNALIEHHDLELDNERANMHDAVAFAQELLIESNKSNLLDFDDLLYFAVKDGLTLPKFDFVLVDEAQDTNAIQRAIIRKIMTPSSRLIAVGDPAQAIYGFRGADSDSMNLIASEFGAIEMPLTVSYRCATNVVKYAQKWVKHIEAAPNAPAGQVINLQHVSLTELIKNTLAHPGGGLHDITFTDPQTGEIITTKSDLLPGFLSTDLLVCRTTKPLIELAYRCLRAKLPVRIMGREIGQGLKFLISKMNAKSVDDLEDKLHVWALREIDKAIAKNLDAKAEAVQDKADCILCLIGGLGEDDPSGDLEPVRTISALLATIDQLFDATVQALTLATIHKSKGMEADRVWWLNSSKQPAKWASKRAWQLNQEHNLCYVAATRAKTTLILIEDSVKEPGDQNDT